MMEAARRCEVKRFLLTSSIGVYAKSKIFNEDSVWKTFPSENDKLLVGLKDYVNYKPRHIRFNMAGMQFL